MSLKTRLTLVAAAAVAVAIALASVVIYMKVRQEQRGRVDDALRDIARSARFISGDPPRFVLPNQPLGGPPGYAQLVSREGAIPVSGEAAVLPTDEETLAVVGGEGEAFFEDMRVRNIHVRVLTVPVVEGLAVQIARPLDEVDRTLSNLRIFLILIGAGGIGVAALVGGLVARAALAPVRKLDAATAHVISTGDLAHRIEVQGNDELSRLADSYNEMLDALEASLALQRQLVADASHELRTPLTSLRTNIEVLAREDDLPSEERRRLRADVHDQLVELTSLVDDLVESARGKEPEQERVEVRLDSVVGEAVERARRSAAKVDIEATLAPTVVVGAPARLERAANNLIDNAIKWSPEGTTVDVVVAGGEVAVRDRGPGIEPADLPHIFDRFYRASSARHLPGSGLGLAIVKQVAEAHGGSVWAEAAEGGGSVFRMRLPVEGSPAPG